MPSVITTHIEYRDILLTINIAQNLSMNERRFVCNEFGICSLVVAALANTQLHGFSEATDSFDSRSIGMKLLGCQAIGLMAS